MRAIPLFGLIIGVAVGCGQPVRAAGTALAPLSWTSTGPLISPVADAQHPIISVKDPTVVYDGGKWHVFATTADRNGAWSMVYLNFRTWAESSAAKPYYLDQNPNLRGYHCAPQVFYFRPQKKWYLIYQSQHPTYSTADKVDQPETWTAPKPFFQAMPRTVVQGWIDYWIICDETHAYLFFSDDYGRWYRSRTRLEDFPNGFDDPVVVMQDANRFNLFEASCVYRLKGSNQYLAFIEGLGGPGGHRFFRAFTADRLDGAWTPLAQANSWETPFAGATNVKSADGGPLWTGDISHGELLRDANDETMTVDPSNLHFLYQGMAAGTPPSDYSQHPYRLALLQADNAARSADAPPSQVLSVTAPTSLVVPRGGTATFAVTATGTAPFTYQWRRNGTEIPGATGPSLSIANVQPEHVGFYSVAVSGSSTTVVSTAAVLELTETDEVVGSGKLVGTDIPHPKGNIYDQILLTGPAASLRADPKQVTRASYIDLDDDIVQVEFAGAGRLSIELTGYSQAAMPLNYDQKIAYVKGNAGITITGADQSTNVSVLSVGRVTAIDQSLFRPGILYDGFADIAYIAISSTNGHFGGVRAGNAGFRATRGWTGIYAPGVQFDGPVYVNDITAFDAATPVFVLGGATDVRITGGSLAQANGKPVAIDGIAHLLFTKGSDSHDHLFAAQQNQGRLEHLGLDLTDRIVASP